MDVHIPATLEGLPLHRRRLEQICEGGIGIEPILGMAISGSVVSGDPDVYSDLDLKVVVEDSSFQDVVDGRDELVNSGGEAVAAFTAEHVGIPEMVITLYDDLIHVDFYFVQLSDFPNTPAHENPHILWERDGSLSRRLEEAEQEEDAFDLDWVESRMWTWTWYTHSKILRGEVYEALDALQYMRTNVLLPLLAVTRGVPPAGSRRAEALVEELEGSFTTTVAKPDRTSAMKALQESVALYQRLVDPLLEAEGKNKAEHARAIVLEALEQGLQWSPPEADD